MKFEIYSLDSRQRDLYPYRNKIKKKRKIMVPFQLWFFYSYLTLFFIILRQVPNLQAFFASSKTCYLGLWTTIAK